VEGFEDGTIPEPSVPGDEVLAVNVFTPRRWRATSATKTGMPVFVWIHGGAFIAGSPHSPWYDGAAFNDAGIVVVSIGYRVGFTGVGNVQGAPANRAVHDWIAALKWVRDNIPAFGGEANRVTIGGQSAGAAAVAHAHGRATAAGLFHRVIASSPVLLQMTPERARVVTEEAASLLDVEPTAPALSTRSRVDSRTSRGRWRASCTCRIRRPSRGSGSIRKSLPRMSRHVAELHGHPLLTQVLNDIMVRSSVASIAEVDEPTWAYDFRWTTGGDIDPGVAFHCLDLPFAWAVPGQRQHERSSPRNDAAGRQPRP
jgi:carboxylesterase type B